MQKQWWRIRHERSFRNRNDTWKLNWSSRIIDNAYTAWTIPDSFQTVPRNKWNPLTTKTSCSGINWSVTYSFDRWDAKSPNFHWKCVEGSRRDGRFSRRSRWEMRDASWMDEFRPTAISRWKDVLALMHTVRGKIVDRITENVMGKRGTNLVARFMSWGGLGFTRWFSNACPRTFSEFRRSFDWFGLSSVASVG